MFNRFFCWLRLFFCPKVVYLSGGIKDFTEEEKHTWRNFCKANIINAETIDPTTISYDGQNPHIVVEQDKSNIDRSTCLLVYYIRPSVGTSMEILYAWERSIPVYIINETYQDLSPWMIYHSNGIFRSLQKAVDYINDGMK